MNDCEIAKNRTFIYSWNHKLMLTRIDLMRRGGYFVWNKVTQ